MPMSTLPAAALVLLLASTAHAFSTTQDIRSDLIAGRAAAAASSSSRFSRLTSTTDEQVAAKLNAYVAEHSSVSRVVPCAHLDVGDVLKLKSAAAALLDPSMTMAYKANDGRRLALPSPPSLGEHGRVAQSQLAAYRDALCAEVIKLWAHHMPASAKTESANLSLPSLPVFSNEMHINYGTSFSCIDGHRIPNYTLAEEQDLSWPRWPLQGHFLSQGHGPFPFWNFGKALEELDDMSRPRNAMTMNVSLSRPYLFNPGNPMEVWYDMHRGVTKFYHSNCDWVLVDVALPSGPCVHQMEGTYGKSTAKWFMYTADSKTKYSDGQFCCDDSFGGGKAEDSFGGSRLLGTMNSRFMDTLIYVGEYDFEGDYYKGRSKRYQQRLTGGVLRLDVWYETDLDGRPLRFAEVATNHTEQELYVDGGYLTSDMLPLLYTDYDNDHWYKGPEAVGGVDFSLPEVCLAKSLADCRAPGEFITQEEFDKHKGSEFWPACSFNLEERLTHLKLQNSVICDQTEGVLIHDAVSTLNHVRPREGCHDYVVLDILPEDYITDCTLGMDCDVCKYVPNSSVIGRLAVTAETCSSTGPRCPDA